MPHINQSPQQKYLSDIEQRGVKRDAAQMLAVKHTERLFQELLKTPTSISLFDRLTRRKVAPPKGLYFWGGVGRGKTYIIDSFFECLPFAQKRRAHFNTFFKEIHRQLGELPKSPDPLEIIAKRIATDYRVVVIDEFHVDDITDAMIIAGLLKGMFENGVVLVTSSNIDVTELYKNGLQRERFVPAITLLQDYTEVVNIDGGTDYRQTLLEKHGLYHSGETVDSTLKEELLAIAPESIAWDQNILINNRPIQAKAISGDIAWFDFDQLCNTPRSSSDYIDLASRYHTILINTLPLLGDGNNDVVQRFIQLVDALYDHRVKLILGAEREPEGIYSGKTLSFAFERTVSRLYEMRSEEYLHRAHAA